ncbi:uncharacterized protein SCHCODRAFT_02517439 [Schizophyllum commune H4-8]|nr:uncharacterized protein SCHCODRAFT_02517439 [Schizophyllum commune H4-8]KAI5886527.1 hypothetical protein SCHCODRAFT_02517439 [Schizophyllum commune H4-8]
MLTATGKKGKAPQAELADDLQTNRAVPLCRSTRARPAVAAPAARKMAKASVAGAPVAPATIAVAPAPAAPEVAPLQPSAMPRASVKSGRASSDPPSPPTPGALFLVLDPLAPVAILYAGRLRSCALWAYLGYEPRALAAPTSQFHTPTQTRRCARVPAAIPSARAAFDAQDPPLPCARAALRENRQYRRYRRAKSSTSDHRKFTPSLIFAVAHAVRVRSSPNNF